MKKLFVIHRIDNIKKEEKQEIFRCNTRKDAENNYPTLKLSETKINISNSLPTTTTNSSADSRKYSLNLLSPEPNSSFNLNPSTNSNSNINDLNEQNKFLGKKIKLDFDEIKDNLENIENDLIQSMENSINEKTEKNNFYNLDSSEIIKKNKKHKETKPFLNEGRWSTEEHTKFIEGLVEFGKNWKDVQKYVGTRTTAQARSHAQKFFLKLKMIKNPILNIDFTNNNIKNLSDVIEEIKQKNENNEDEKKFIINTLKSLSDTISNETNEINKKRIKKTKFNLERKKTVNEINTEKTELLNENKTFSEKIELNEEKPEEIKIIEETKKEMENNNIIIDNTINNINNINKNDIVEENIKKDETINFIEKYDEFQINKRLIIDDGIAFFPDNNNNDCFYCNNISLRIKEYYYNKNFESIINKNFFS